MIYHYTSIATLALILQSCRIRFNRLDRVDDITESQTAVGIEFGKYFFVSCWTKSPVENIPLWSMYSNAMQGVRIGLPDYPFATAPLVPPANWGMQQSGVITSPLSIQEMFTDVYFVPPLFLTPDFFAGPVDYVPDVTAAYRANVSLTGTHQKKLELKNMKMLPRTKNLHWKFQEEHRFCLFITPSLPVPTGGIGADDFATRLPNHILNTFVRKVDPGISYFDLRLDPQAAANMEIVLGPLAAEADYAQLLALRNQHCSGASLTRSVLTGQIRVRTGNNVNPAG